MGRTRLPEHVRAMIPAEQMEDTRPRAERIVLTLPFPPSLNGLYPTIKTPSGKLRRVKSEPAKAYFKQVAEAVEHWIWSTQQQPPAPPWALTLRAYPPQDKRRHDLTNLFKAPEDAVMAAIGGDDDDVLVVAGQKMPKSPRPRIELTLESAAALGVRTG